MSEQNEGAAYQKTLELLNGNKSRRQVRFVAVSSLLIRQTPATTRVVPIGVLEASALRTSVVLNFRNDVIIASVDAYFAVSADNFLVLGGLLST